MFPLQLHAKTLFSLDPPKLYGIPVDSHGTVLVPSLFGVISNLSRYHYHHHYSTYNTIRWLPRNGKKHPSISGPETKEKLKGKEVGRETAIDKKSFPFRLIFVAKSGLSSLGGKRRRPFSFLLHGKAPHKGPCSREKLKFSI